MARTGVLWSRLDIDEIADDRASAAGPGRVRSRSAVRAGHAHRHALSAVPLRPIEYKRPSWLARGCEEDLGRIYRRFLDRGLELTVNGQPRPGRGPAVPPAVCADTAVPGRSATSWCTGCRTDHGDGEIRVRFAELPDRPVALAVVGGEAGARDHERAVGVGAARGPGDRPGLVLHGRQAPRELRRLVAMRGSVRPDAG